KVNVVGSLVGHKLLFDFPQDRRRICELRQYPRRAARGSPDKVIRRVCRRFVTHQEPASIRAEQRDERFAAARFATEDAFGFQGLQIETIEERQVALW